MIASKAQAEAAELRRIRRHFAMNRRAEPDSAPYGRLARCRANGCLVREQIDVPILQAFGADPKTDSVHGVGHAFPVTAHHWKRAS